MAKTILTEPIQREPISELSLADVVVRLEQKPTNPFPGVDIMTRAGGKQSTTSVDQPEMSVAYREQVRAFVLATIAEVRRLGRYPPGTDTVD